MRRILWADDDGRWLAPYAAAMSGDGVSFTFAPDLSTALDRLKRERWDDVIIDIGIEDGNLEARHPNVLAAMGVDGTTTGVELARYLLGAEPPMRRDAASIVICSAFRRELLEERAPDLMKRLAYVSKSSRTFEEGRFLSDLRKALRLPGGDTGRDPPPVTAIELPFLDAYHDLKVAVRSAIPSLQRVGERLREFSGGSGISLGGLLDDAVGKGSSAVEAAFGVNGASRSDLGALEDALSELDAARSGQTPPGYTELIPLVDNMQRRLARLPRGRGTDAAFDACQALQTRLCATEIDRVTARMLSEFSAIQPELDAEAHSFDSSKLVSSTLDNAEPQALAARTEFERNVAADLVVHTARPGQGHLFQTALKNIVDNAIKYQGRLPIGNSWIRVAHRRDRGWIETSIESWGPPIRLDSIAQVFERGRRGDMARRQGDGQGLAIAHRCIQALGGSIKPQSAPTKGANSVNTFTVRVPERPRSDE